MSTVKLYIDTPLVESYELSKIAGFKVYLKLENTQPADSFKIRGLSYHIQQSVQRGCKRLVASSGGNAGLAAAYAARKLDIPIHVYVPSTTPETMVERIRGEGAKVTIHGSVWNEANAKAMEEAEDSECAFIHPFDHPETWEGHATIIDEIASKLDGRPDVVVASVGGGGLMNGLVIGMERNNWKDVPLVAMETEGANCFNEALKAGKVVTLPAITSVAKTLGALSVSAQLFHSSKQRPILSELVSDKEAVSSCVRFADDHRMLVEPSCGAALAAVYTGVLNRLKENNKLTSLNTAVIIVCGGHSTSFKQLEAWQEEVGLK